ncbi:MAG TPA: Gfo/Idh/MocA family oxidoreductase, partial [Clostridia bacterium]|nr:Gfo/Idh/MocA family oxidoreductase [Clostridia bacterium]
MNKLRIGVIGLGNRGFYLIKHTLLKLEDVEVTAVCDEYEDRVENAAAEVFAASGKTPFKTTDYTKVLMRGDVDAMVVSTAWESHIEIAASSMEAGKITAM